MSDWAGLGVYAAGWMATVRLLVWLDARDARRGVAGEELPMMATIVAAFLWPLLLAVAAVVFPILGAAWLASYGVRRR